jgi:hypothetical protein
VLGGVQGKPLHAAARGPCCARHSPRGRCSPIHARPKFAPLASIAWCPKTGCGSRGLAIDRSLAHSSIARCLARGAAEKITSTRALLEAILANELPELPRG